ncbi:MAG: sigma-54 dependent transcriptional regulator [Fusobacteriaceae bacterium]|nr:sigma-54 dependent transcriptional regulator [Fusobacteriaceae bacterium]
MTLLGFRIYDALKNQLENNCENELIFTETISEFTKHTKSKRYEAIILEETSFLREDLLELIRNTRDLQKNAVIIVFGETSNLDLVAGCIKAGAYDYILIPEDTEKIIKIIEKSVKDHKLLAEKVSRNKITGDKLIGQSKEIVEMYKMIGKVASIVMPVLVIGEKGTGKTSVAKAIHQFSDPSNKSFISINCLSFPAELLERRIFGYEKGAFKDAVLSQAGDLEKANGGTLHFGNIEALTFDMQSKLLYFLEEGKFYRMGGIEDISVNVRIIATTSENLEEMINKGEFIEELYSKLKVLEITIPPLRERIMDIPFIIDHYLIECNEQLNKNVKGVSKPALNKLLRYDWPGNVNELKTAIKSAVALCRGNSILHEDLPSAVLGTKILKKKEDSQVSVLKDWVKGEIFLYKGLNKNNYYSNIMSKLEKELIKQTLEITNGKKIETAELLGITRNTLRSKMNNYGLD